MKTSRLFLIFCVIAFTSVIAGCSEDTKQVSDPPTHEEVMIEAPQDNAPESDMQEKNIEPGEYRLTEVMEHDDDDDCWMIINAKIYDVTEFIESHPGGSVIEQGCGKDATALYMSKPGSGTPHPEKAMSMLEDYYIGELKDLE